MLALCAQAGLRGRLAQQSGYESLTTSHVQVFCAIRCPNVAAFRFLGYEVLHM